MTPSRDYHMTIMWLYHMTITRLSYDYLVVLPFTLSLAFYPSTMTLNNNNNNNNSRIQRCYSRFFTISSQCRELSPTRTLKWPRRNRVQIKCNTSSAYHVQHVMLRATWYEGTGQLLSLTELNCIYLSFILLAESLNR